MSRDVPFSRRGDTLVDLLIGTGLWRNITKTLVFPPERDARTTVETEKTRHRTGTFLAAESAPVLRGDGDISYACGGCGDVLIEGVERGDIRSFFILCPRCDATSFVDADAV